MNEIGETKKLNFPMNTKLMPQEHKNILLMKIDITFY